MLLPNLERHVKSNGHVRCLEIQTGTTQEKSQSSLSRSFGSPKERALAVVTPLIRIACYLGRTEMPFNRFIDEVELHIDNGCKITQAYNNREGCKAFIHLMAEEFSYEQKTMLSETNFDSWLIDGEKTMFGRKIVQRATHQEHRKSFH